LSFLVFAYACEPDKGSEPGAGWNWARALATLDQTYVITRSNNAEVIERWLPLISERDQLTFIFVDLPGWARSWKKGRRGHRLYYLLWQIAAMRRAMRERDEGVGFDTAWHLTIANLWMGSLAPFAGKRFVLGPVGGGAALPLRLMPVLGFRGAIFELGRGLVTTVARYVNPLARLAWRRAEVILVQNPETRAWLPKRHRHKATVFPNALLAVPEVTQVARTADQSAPPTMLFAGMLLPLKGVGLAISAVELLPEWRLIICGSGPDETRLRRIVARRKLLDRVEFRGWVSREELMRVMNEEAHVFVFPSLHDQAGFAVAEATAAGLPTVCLNRGGPKLMGGMPVQIDSPRATALALASAIVRARDVRPEPLPKRSQQLLRLRRILDEHDLLRGSRPISPGQPSSLPDEV
jgi:glycosyltransferase involved in cell wall biosynthesis